jgi:biopolymer transport protein ExbB
MLAELINTDAILEQLRTLWEQAHTIWLNGGWCMPALAATALLMFGLGMHLHLKLRATGFQAVAEKKWRRWINRPNERRGPIGEILDFVTGARSLKQSALFFEELRTAEVAPFAQDLRVMKICVGAAPLLGLLGTVTGMLATFEALSTGGGGQKTMDMIAAGISEALITTETGLVIALPGLFFQHHLARKYDRYKAFLAHMETACAQDLYRKLRGQSAEGAAAA